MQPEMGARTVRSLTAPPPAVAAASSGSSDRVVAVDSTGSQAGSSVQRGAAGDGGAQDAAKEEPQGTGRDPEESQDSGREPGEPSGSVDEADEEGTADADNEVALRRTQQPLRWNVIARVLNWLRAGYPDGVPRSDYLALYAVLRRHLSDSEIETIAEEVAHANPDTEITRDAIEVAVARFAKQQPEPADVVRVAAGLADAGWPLADPPWDRE